MVNGKVMRIAQTGQLKKILNYKKRKEKTWFLENTEHARSPAQMST